MTTPGEEYYKNLNLDVEVVIEKAEGKMCPRCWKFDGITENVEGLCDRCSKALLETNAEDYSNDASEQEIFKQFQERILTTYEQQDKKYRRKP